MTLVTLPRDTIFQIALNLKADEIVPWKRVCKLFHQVLGEETLWSFVYSRDYPGKNHGYATFQESALWFWAARWKLVQGKFPFVTKHPEYTNVMGWHPIAVSPYNRQIVVLGEAYPDVVKVWNRETNVCTTSDVLPHSNATAIAIMNPDRFITSSRVGIEVWDLQTVKMVDQLSSRGPLRLSLAKASNNEAISGDWGGKITLWDLEQKTHQIWQEGHTTVVSTLISCRDTTFFSGSADRTIKTWDRRTTKCTQTFTGHKEVVNSLTQPDDFTLISASGDFTIKMWDVRTNGCLRTLEGHQHVVRAVTLFDEETLISGSDDMTIKVWKWKEGQCAQTYGPLSNHVSYVVKLDDGEVFLKVAQEAAQVWDFTKSGQPVPQTPAQTSIWARAYNYVSPYFKWF